MTRPAGSISETAFQFAPPSALRKQTLPFADDQGLLVENSEADEAFVEVRPGLALIGAVAKLAAALVPQGDEMLAPLFPVDGPEVEVRGLAGDPGLAAVGGECMLP